MVGSALALDTKIDSEANKGHGEIIWWFEVTRVMFELIDGKEPHGNTQRN